MVVEEVDKLILHLVVMVVLVDQVVEEQVRLLLLVVMLQHLQPHLQRNHQLILVVRVIRQMVEMDILVVIPLFLVAVVGPEGPEWMVLLQQIHMMELLVV